MEIRLKNHFWPLTLNYRQFFFKYQFIAKQQYFIYQKRVTKRKVLVDFGNMHKKTKFAMLLSHSAGLYPSLPLKRFAFSLFSEFISQAKLLLSFVLQEMANSAKSLLKMENGKKWIEMILIFKANRIQFCKI